MRKMGNFKGLPVYLVNGYQEVINIDYGEEKLYVINGKLTYHGTEIADVHNGNLFNFDEDKFNELRRKSWSEDESKLLAKTTGSAETRPQEEEEPVHEYSDPAAADEFMLHWRDYIDDEIANLKKVVSEICSC